MFFDLSVKSRFINVKFEINLSTFLLILALISVFDLWILRGVFLTPEESIAYGEFYKS